MGIRVEFNPDLALRAFGTQGRLKTECLPKRLSAGDKRGSQKAKRKTGKLAAKRPNQKPERRIHILGYPRNHSKDERQGRSA